VALGDANVFFCSRRFTHNILVLFVNGETLTARRRAVDVRTLYDENGDVAGKHGYTHTHVRSAISSFDGFDNRLCCTKQCNTRLSRGPRCFGTVGLVSRTRDRGTDATRVRRIRIRFEIDSLRFRIVLVWYTSDTDPIVTFSGGQISKTNETIVEPDRFVVRRKETNHFPSQTVRKIPYEY